MPCKAGMERKDLLGANGKTALTENELKEEKALVAELLGK